MNDPRAHAVFSLLRTRQVQVDHRMQFFRPVNPLHVAVFQIIENLRHYQFRFTDHHGVSMGQGFFAHEARVHATHDYGNTAPAKLVGDLVSAIDIAGHGRYADHIDLGIEIDFLDVLVGHDDLVLVLRNAGRDREKAGQWGIERPVHVAGAGREGVRLRIDEMNDPRAHAISLPPADAGARFLIAA